MHAFQVTPVIGLPKFNGWSQAVTNARKSFVCVFSVSGDDAGNVGREVVDLLATHDPKTPTHLHDLAKLVIDLVEQKDCHLQLSCSFFDDNTSTLVTYNGTIWLKRGQRVGKLLSSDQAFKIIQGKYFLDDDFILVTSQTEAMWGEINQKFSQGYEVDTIITSIVPGLHAQTDSSLSALAFVKIINQSAEANDEFPNNSQPPIESFLDKNQEIINLAPPKELQDKKTTRLALILKKLNQLIGFVKKIDRKKIINQLIVKKNDFFSSSKNKLKVFFSVVVLFLIIGLSGFFYYSQQKQVKNAHQSVDPLMIQLEQIKTDQDINLLQSREKVQQVIVDLESLQPQLVKNRATKKILNDSLNQAKTYFDQISGQKLVEEFPTFFDLRLVVEAFIAKDMEVVNDKLVFLDVDSSKLVELNYSNKQAGTRVLPSDEKYKGLTSDQNSLYLLANSLYGADVDNDAFEKVIENQDRLDQSTLVGVYDENIYLLSPTLRNIFRFKKEDGKYDQSQSWLKNFEGISFIDISSMVIDGDIWLGSKDGKIFRLRSGQKIDFELKGLPDPLEGDLIITTSQQGNYLYILENSKKRIIIINKNGEFYKEIKSPILSAVTDIAVTGDGQRLFGVSGSLVFEINLADDNL